MGALLGSALLAGAATAGTLDDVKARGELICGVNTGTPGFGAPDASGKWTGFDVDLCRAVAAAVLGDPNKVKFVPTTSETRFTALASGEVDTLIRNSTWTFSRDTDLKLDFVAVNYYDGQGFLIKKDAGVKSVKELNGATVCVQTGTTGELNITDYFKANNIEYKAVNVADPAEGTRQYESGACDVITDDVTALSSLRAGLAKPDDHMLLPEVISKEPLGPVVRHGDNNWGDIVRWVYFSLLIAEEKGITKANIDEVKGSTQDAEVKRLLSVDDDMGKMMGLSKDWAYNAIKAVGNYGEVFESNLGPSTPIGLPRGINELWSKGGLQYAPPLR